ncbi:MAG: penicillin-binding protein 1C [Gemmatimonadota bacterium]|nr:penicillin-binding protein 1C [Gemmatimonadota bacterium]
MMSGRRRAAVLALGALAATSVAAFGWTGLPLPAGIIAPAAAPGVTLEDRHGIVLRSSRAEDGSRMRWMRLDEIDPKIIQAFVAAEDRRYYDHGALDWRALGRAVRDNVLAMRVVSGASTITMQTARLVHPSRRSFAGKISQVMWSLRLEAHLTKQQLLEQYLNRVPLGQGAIGVAAASALYFGASARDVSLAQAATLAGLAHAPSVDNPLVSPSRARARRAFALARLRRLGAATETDLEHAAAEPLLVRRPASPFLAPHFTTRVLRWADDDSLAHRDGDATIRTSIDLALQQGIELEVRRTVEEMRARGGQQAAAVVLDNRSGEILAWVGSPDFWSDSAGQTDMVASPRQPGSALKPFLYGLAFDRGYTPASILADVARTYQTVTGAYHPRNYDRTMHGPVRAREALASSYNIPAVELANDVGAPALLSTLHRAGFASLGKSAEHYGLGLALGNGDVTLVELANAYRALANGGMWRPYHWTAVADGTADGARGERVMSASSAALVLDILSDAEARIPGFGLETPFDFPFPVAVKTGTSRHFTDNWSAATTGNFTVAVWVGDFNGQPMDGVSGVTGAGPLLRRAVLLTAARVSAGELPTPASTGATSISICRVSGLRAGPDCPHSLEWFAAGREPSRECDWHRGGRVVLPARFAEWSAQHGGATDDVHVAAHSAAPDSVDDAHFRIVSPRDGDRYRVPPGVERRYSTVAMVATGPEAAHVRWFIDGRPTSTTRFPLVTGTHTISARTPADSARVTVRVE